ncbi:hypothetical protein LZ24_00677 [Desulfobotulus alkaliphilus]|uniref:Recombinase n=1 Tax=Desulfobotulus alkaliphilus TaxID=622671 RepID=A0A562S4L1_9BACT|nr:hypothetical protein [Desulfobotulus alkaliphilus]TWI75626.1 hypothetical protein LZ24_00677 [Desulfobotulus alkaliphilus]
MNDFLQNLRNQSAAKERRFNKPAKGSHDNNPNTPGHTERRTGQDRRASRMPQGQAPVIREETILALQASLESLIETQRDRIFMEDRKAEAEERKAEALERLADSLDRLLDNISSPSAAPPPPAEENNGTPARENPVRDPEFLDTTEDDVRKTSRKYILKLIEKLRKDNMTYEQIAAYLTDNDYPTFSGRGRWHAQTIHRLCR